MKHSILWHPIKRVDFNPLPILLLRAISLCKMVKRVELSTETRCHCVVFSEQKKSNCQIAKDLKIFEGAVRKTLKRHKKTGSVEDLPRSGRPRVISKRTDHAIYRASLRDRRKTSLKIKEESVASTTKPVELVFSLTTSSNASIGQNSTKNGHQSNWKR